MGWTVLLALAAFAAQPAGVDGQQRVWDAAMQAASKGPAEVPLRDQAVLHLPADEVFVPQPQADRLLALFGNPGGNPEMAGIILPRDPGATWYMPVAFHKVGHVADDEAHSWDVDAMLAAYRADTADHNAERVRTRQPAVEAVDWVERPHYDPATRRLVWAMSARLAGAPADAPVNVNYNTDVLGREGYFSLNLVAATADLPALKTVAERQLEAVEFMPGKRYADFDAHTDHAASQGLSMLVLGAAGGHGDGGALAFVAKYAVPLLIGLLALLFGAALLLRRKPAADDDGDAA